MVAIVFALIVVLLIVNQIFRSFLNNTRKRNQGTYTADSIQERTYSEAAGVPSFSAKSGFYDDEFSLTLTAKEGEIYYTLDGTDPATNTNALHYEAPIHIYDNTMDPNVLSSEPDITLGYYSSPDYKVDKGIILRAAIKDASGNFGTTITQSYFVGKTADYYQNLKVISLVTNPYNLFDEDYGIYVVGNGYYQWKKSKDFDPEMQDWREDNPTNYNNRGEEWERPAVVQIFEEGELVYEQNLGIRLAGHVSRSNAQKSIRLYAKEAYGEKKLNYAFFDDLKDINNEPIVTFDKVTLRNDGNDTTSAFFRDELVQAMCADLDVGIQAEEPCILFIDGEFWGMYHIKERLEREYFASHYDVDKKNVTCIRCDEVEGSEEIQKEYEDFYHWAMSSDLTEEANYRKVADTIDLQSLMDYFAIQTYINNYDWLKKDSSPNNIMMWRVNEKVDGNPYADGKWRFVLYDTEYSAGLYGQEGTQPEFNSLSNISKDVEWDNPGALFFRLLYNDTFKQAFYANYIDIMENNFDPDRVLAWIDEYCAEYGSPISDTFSRYIAWEEGAQHFTNNVNTVKDFYTRRPTYAKRYLDKLCK